MSSNGFVRNTLVAIEKFLHPHLGPSMGMEGRKVPTSAGDLFVYEDTKGEGAPVVLVHSVNAAASSYEMRPLFELLLGRKPVLAFDLPGFGRSERGPREYNRELYRAAVLAMIDRAAQRRGGPVHVVALSLGCEFAAAAALERPESVLSLTMISPTGLGSSRARMQENAKSGRSERALRALSIPLVGAPLYAALASRPSIHYFLSKSFFGPVDEGLERYAYASAHQIGARYAPLAFLSGALFDPEVTSQVYEKLSCPVLVIHDEDAYTDFTRLPEMVRSSPAWVAARVEPTRGLPHFEKPEQTLLALKTFWSPLDAEDRRMADATGVQPGY